MDIIVVIGIVAIAGIYLVRRFYKGLKNGHSCGCGSCNACGKLKSNSCDQ